MAKLPAKFDDVSKTAASLLGDDFQCKGYQLKTKQKTSATEGFHPGAHVELVTDVFPSTGDSKTPTKLSFKFPKPLAMLQGVSIEKFDLDKDGKYKMEVAVGKDLHGVDGLKLELKSDLSKDLTYHSTYTGMKDVAVKLDIKHFAPTDFTLECLHATGPVVVGAKLNGLGVPNMGASFLSGDFFASILAKNTFSEFTGHGHYKVSNDMKVAATYQHGGKTTGSWAVGGSAAVGADTVAKAKFESNNTLSLAVKRSLAKGATLFAGLSYGLNNGQVGYGAKLAIE